MNIKVYMKDGKEFELDYPSRKNIATEKFEYAFVDNQEVIDAFEADVESLRGIKKPNLKENHVTLDNLTREITIFASEIAAYEVNRIR